MAPSTPKGTSLSTLAPATPTLSASPVSIRVIGVKGVVLKRQGLKLAVLAGIGKNGVLVCNEMSTVAVPLASKTFW